MTENKEKKKLSIEETIDVIDYADALVHELAAKKAGDGKIDGAEIAMVLGKTAPKGVDAIWGINNVDDELADLDEAEKKILGEKAFPILINLIRMFQP